MGKNTSRRGFIAGASALTLAAGTAPRAFAAAADEATLLAGAKREGSATVYSNVDPEAIDRSVKAFTAKYGVKIDVQRLTGAALAQRFSAEYDTNVNLADLFFSSDPVFPKDAIKKGMLLRPDELPSMGHWPKNDTKDGLVSLGINPYTLVWNTNQVSGDLTSWEVLNDLKYRGKVLVGDPRVLASARLWYVALRQKYGDKFIQDLGSHAAFSPSAVPGVQQLAAGAVSVYAPATYLNVTGFTSKGAPIKYALVDPIVVSTPFAGIVAKAPHPNAGRLFLNYLMSIEGQEVLNSGSFSLLPNVKGALSLPRPPADIDSNEGEKQLPQLLSLLKLG